MFLRQIGKAFFVAALWLLAQPLIGRGTVAQVPDDIRASLTARGHALLIGVAVYNHNAWPELRSVTADIDDLTQGLRPHFATIETLINPTVEILSKNYGSS